MTPDPAPRRGTVDVAGTRLAFRETGPAGGIPVVALHGMGSGAATWNVLAGMLAAAGRRTVAVDLRGHGGSGRPGDYALAAFRDDVAGLLDRLGADTVDLVGHSLGGHVATLVAMKQPERVRRLVLEDTPPPPRDAAEEPAARLGRTRLGSVLGAAAALTRRRAFDPRMVQPVLGQLRRPDPSWWLALRHVTADTLVVAAGPGSQVPREAQAEVAATLPHARMVVVEEAGHRIHSTRPAEYVEVVLPFLTADPP